MSSTGQPLKHGTAAASTIMKKRQLFDLRDILLW